jgi:hypothetical protein
MLSPEKKYSTCYLQLVEAFFKLNKSWGGGVLGRHLEYSAAVDRCKVYHPFEFGTVQCGLTVPLIKGVNIYNCFRLYVVALGI